MFFDDTASHTTLGKAVSSGKIRRLAPRVFSADLAAPPENLIHRNWAQVAHHLVPGAVIVDRSAARPETITRDNLLTLAAETSRRQIKLPGLEIRIRQGKRQPGDTVYAQGLFMSGNARILLDNLRVTRGHNYKTASTLTLGELEDWLTAKAIVWGAQRIQRLKSDALELAGQHHSPGHLAQIEALFGRLDGQLQPRRQSSDFFKVHRQGKAWDTRVVAMLETAARTLPVNLAQGQVPTQGQVSPQEQVPAQEAPGTEPAQEAPEPAEALAFYESYFSNFIEGTEFTLSQARQIIKTQTPPPERTADGHDILGTYRCIADTELRAKTSTEPDELVDLLQQRHSQIMQGRPEMRPGEWKTANNQIGGYVFVDPQLVEGTLNKGLQLLTSLEEGIQRALFALLVVNEVHPFADGNGRAARLMMNAELSHAGACRIIVPNIFRTEYISSLRRFSAHDGDTTALVRVMDFAWRWTASMPWSEPDVAEAAVVATNALMDPQEALESGKRLELP